MSFFRSPNINKTDYYIHSHTYVPQDLASGDIIETHDGERLALVLGFVYNKFTQAINTIHTAEIIRQAALPKSRPIFSIETEARRSGDVFGIDLPAYILTDRTDRFPIDMVFRLNKRIERVGRMSSNYFQEILKDLCQNNIGKLPRVGGEDIYIPSLKHLMKPSKEEDSEGLLAYGRIGAHERASLLRTLNSLSRSVDGDCIHTQYWDEKRDRHEEGFQGYLVGKQRAKEAMRLPMQMGTRRAHTVSLARQFDVTNTPSFEAPVEKRTGDEKALKATFRDCTLPDHIILPKDLWQGRYLMINAPNLHGEPPVKEGSIVYRPCALWKAYADKDTYEIVGLELHPATRSQSENYNFKMQINPLKTLSKKESLLIADCLIRVPLSPEYVHADAGINFSELTSEEVNRFKQRKRVMEAQNASQHIIGLQTVPDNWIEIAIDPALSGKKLRKKIGLENSRSDGMLQEKLREVLQLRQPA